MNCLQCPELEKSYRVRVEHFVVLMAWKNRAAHEGRPQPERLDAAIAKAEARLLAAWGRLSTHTKAHSGATFLEESTG